MNNSRFCYLSWEILKNKVLYYRPTNKYLKKYKMVSDEEYDNMEIEYLKLCLTLGKPNTLVHKEYEEFKEAGVGMMEIDQDRPSVRFMILTLLGKL